jgi:spoIIIJ-associated protein
MDKQTPDKQAPVKISKDNLKVIKEIVDELLKLLEVEVKPVIEEKDGLVNIQFQTDNPGILIGYHGDTLASLQIMLSMMVYRKLGFWVRILVDVGDYRERRKETLDKMALSAAQKVKFSGQEYAFPPMSSGDRRIIHIALSENPDVATESQGEGFERRVVVKPKVA